MHCLTMVWTPTGIEPADYDDDGLTNVFKSSCSSIGQYNP